MFELVITSKEDLRKEIISALNDFEIQRKKHTPQRLYTINQVAKQLGKAHATIKKLVQSGVIRSTKSGLIPEDAIEEYLKG